MVSPLQPSTPSTPSTPAGAPADPLQAQHAHYVEQHFPHQMSWYAPEGPQGAMESAARWIRENPRRALVSAAAAGLVLGFLTKPAARGTVAGARALLRSRRPSCACAD